MVDMINMKNNSKVYTTCIYHVIMFYMVYNSKKYEKGWIDVIILFICVIFSIKSIEGIAKYYEDKIEHLEKFISVGFIDLKNDMQKKEKKL